MERSNLPCIAWKIDRVNNETGESERCGFGNGQTAEEIIEMARSSIDKPGYTITAVPATQFPLIY